MYIYKAARENDRDSGSAQKVTLFIDGFKHVLNIAYIAELDLKA